MENLTDSRIKEISNILLPLGYEISENGINEEKTFGLEFLHFNKSTLTNRFHYRDYKKRTIQPYGKYIHITYSKKNDSFSIIYEYKANVRYYRHKFFEIETIEKSYQYTSDFNELLKLIVDNLLITNS